MRNTGREKFRRYSSLLYFFSKIFKLAGGKINFYLFVTFRNTPGNLGIALRYIFLSNIAKKVGKNISIQPNVFLFNPQNIQFGSNVSIHPMCYIEGIGGINIGNDVSIAHSSTLISSNHSWNDLSTPIKYNPERLSPICIEDDVWIGCGVRILAGVTVKRRSIIAAGAVVNKSFETNVILAGVPAKAINKINV